MLDLDHLEELFHLLNILNDKQVSSFIEHYNASEIEKSKDPSLDALVKSSKTSFELRESVKGALAKELEDEYTNIQSTVSEKRKKGLDVYIPGVKAMSIPLKISIFKATGEKKDFYKVKKIMHEIEEELSQVQDNKKEPKKKQGSIVNKSKESQDQKS